MISQIDLIKAFDPLLANWLSFLGLFVIFIIVKILSSPRFKGSSGERGVRLDWPFLIPPSITQFHDLYVLRPDGQGSTQIDHVVISPFGIFVIETKNYKGWITVFTASSCKSGG